RLGRRERGRWHAGVAPAGAAAGRRRGRRPRGDLTMTGRWQWVATPPPQSGASRGGRRRPLPYTGPPSYPVPPRWGFPQLSWRWPVSLGRKAKPEPLDRLRMLSRNLVATLWVTAAALGVAVAGEGWRYALLILSRGGALSRSVVAFSDALVVTAGVVSSL